MSVLITVNHNPNQKRKFSIIQTDKLTIKFHTRELPYDLHYLADELANTIILKKPYSIQYNFKSVPESARKDLKFKNKIQKLFSSPSNEIIDVEICAKIVLNHISRFPNSPDFKNYFLPKNTTKIHNFIKNILNNNKITRIQSVKIAQLVSEKL